MINNEFYNQLGDGWINRFDHPVALLRKENAIRSPWVLQELDCRIGKKVSALDIGCGAGFLSNSLAEAGHCVTGIDLSLSSLEVAKKQDGTGQVQYLQANAYSLPFPNQSFDVVLAMDILEHVEEPQLLIAEASRVLKPKGMLFFHTFNRNAISYLVVIKGVEWFVKNTPQKMHDYSLFIRPKELEEYFSIYKLKALEWRGLAPKIFSRPMLKMVCSRSVPSDFSFKFTRSLLTGYCGIAEKQTHY